MKVFDQNHIPSLTAPTVVILGAFDGMHLGHQRLVQKGRELARKNGWKTLLYTFANHPLSVLAPEKPPLPLTTREEKLALCEELGLDYVAMVEFTPEFSAMKPEAFLEQIFREYHARGLVSGFNFHFGQKGLGDAALIREVCRKKNAYAVIVDPVCMSGRPISSSWIRSCIAGGDVERARALLGRPYTIAGDVVQGKQFGRTMGFRTANLRPGKKLLPGFGVYITDTLVEEKRYHSITNVGDNPTVSNDGTPVIETHLFDCEEELYGRPIKVEFLKRIREERKFSSKEELRKQISRDVGTAKNYFRL